MRARRKIPKIKKLSKASSKGIPMGLLMITSRKKLTLSLSPSSAKFTLKMVKPNTLRNSYSPFLHLIRLLDSLLMSFLNHKFSILYLTLQFPKIQPQFHPKLQFLPQLQLHQQHILTTIHNLP